LTGLERRRLARGRPPGGGVLLVHGRLRSPIKGSMPIVRPFTGLLYDPNVAGPIEAVSAPPYDTISPIDQERYHRLSPYNVVRLILGKEQPGDRDEDNKYTRAASFLRSWRESGALQPTPRPAV